MTISWLGRLVATRGAGGHRVPVFTVLASLTALLGTVTPAATAATHAVRGVKIEVLDGRADLIAGGTTLVAVDLPAGTSTRRVSVRLNGTNVTRDFALRHNGRYEGLVGGLRLGSNVLIASLPNGRRARIVLTNHPNGGPVFAGPQVEPWTCQPGARDRACDQPPTYSYLYLPKGGGALMPYDPAHPPGNVAMTTTDQGLTVPFIVRQEIGYQDRDQYEMLVLFNPEKPWPGPWAPQPQWNGKLLITHGANCQGTYGVSSTQLADNVSESPVLPDSYVTGLGRGFGVLSTALDNSGVDCNIALQAESLIMAKQHFVDEYGAIRYTIGTGCSGGSLAAQEIANAYPGVYQGLVVTCAFPDAWSMIPYGSTDVRLFDDFFTNPANAPGWTPSQIAAVEGEATPFPALTSDAAFNDLLGLTDPTGNALRDVSNNPTPCADVPLAQRYNAVTNPSGIRCSVQDWGINVLGPRPRASWSANEVKIGRGFAGLPYGEVGMTWGMKALKDGVISPAQFAELNARIGDVNIDFQPITSRRAADTASVRAAYRSGAVNEANNLNTVAILDGSGPNDPGTEHPTVPAFMLRARLDRNFGEHANQAIWGGPVQIIGNVDFFRKGLIAMDGWLAAVARDHSTRLLAQKIIADRPADMHDTCFNGLFGVVNSGLCSFVPVYSFPRVVAGEPLTNDVMQCQLKPLQRSDFPVTFTTSEWAGLESAFPTGICDFSKPGVDQQPTRPWQTYQTASGSVIYGGKPMGPPPQSVACTNHTRPVHGLQPCTQTQAAKRSHKPAP